MICSKCATSTNENCAFCPQCGENLNPFANESEITLQTNQQNAPIEASTTPDIETPVDTFAQEAVPPCFDSEKNIYNKYQDEQPVNQRFFINPDFQPSYVQPPRDPGRDFAVASLVLGIVSYILLCAFFVGWPGTFATTITGIVLGAKSIKKSKQIGTTNGMAIVGVITSAVALALVTGICLLYLGLFITAIEYSSTEFMNELI